MLQEASIAKLLPNILDLALMLQQQRACSTYQWGRVRLAATGPVRAFVPDAPPESAFLKLVRGLKTAPHPALVALGISDLPPAAFQAGDSAVLDKSVTLWLPPEQREYMVSMVQNFANAILDADKVRRSCHLHHGLCLAAHFVSGYFWPLRNPQDYRSESEETYYQRFRKVLIAGALCLVLAMAEIMQQVHYVANLKWSAAAAGDLSVGGSTASIPPTRPHLSFFLEALRAAAKEGFPLLGIKVDK